MVHWERENIKNRKKLVAEGSWIRNRVDEWLGQGHGVIVVGDINDGPGMDFYESRFGKSAVEIIMGSIYEPDAILKNYIRMPKWGRYGWSPSSSNFRDKFTGSKVNVLIDHILVSRDINIVDGSHRVWNPSQDDDARPLKKMLLESSDHFPVTIEIA